MKKNRMAVFMLFAAAVCWSTSGILIKLVSLHPMAIAGWRSLIAGLFILVVCKKTVKISWDAPSLGAALCLGAFCVCFVGATKLSTAANAIVLQYAASAYVAVLAPRLLGEPTRRSDWFILVLVILGIGLFFMDDLSMEGRLGIFIGILGSVFWAGTMIFLRKAKEQSTSWPLSLGNFMAAACCLPFMFRQMPGLTDSLGVLGLGVISIGAGYAIFSYAIKEVQALDAVLICSIEPFINPLWVFLFFGELPGPAALAGCSLVLLAVTARSVMAATGEQGVSEAA
ncbi:MAG: DMT family transporter [Desulfobacterales bacterium]|nr:DMT family transporter [Desulfobacterales bacterium]